MNFFSGSFSEKEIKGGEEALRRFKTEMRGEGVDWGWIMNLVSNARCFKWRRGGVGENRKSGMGEFSGFYGVSVDCGLLDKMRDPLLLSLKGSRGEASGPRVWERPNGLPWSIQLREDREGLANSEEYPSTCLHEDRWSSKKEEWKY